MSAYDDPAATKPLTKEQRQRAREHAVAVGEHVSELDGPGPADLAMADLLLLAERVIRLVDQVDRTEAGVSGAGRKGGDPVPDGVDPADYWRDRWATTASALVDALTEVDELRGMTVAPPAEPSAMPDRIAVDANGYGWRVWDDEELWSMVPQNPDNSPVPEPVTWYVREER